MPVGVVHTALDDGHFGRKTAEKKWGRRGVGTVVGHLQNRLRPRVGVNGYILLPHLDVAVREDAGRAAAQEDGYRVVSVPSSTCCLKVAVGSKGHRCPVRLCRKLVSYYHRASSGEGKM